MAWRIEYSRRRPAAAPARSPGARFRVAGPQLRRSSIAGSGRSARLTVWPEGPRSRAAASPSRAGSAAAGRAGLCCCQPGGLCCCQPGGALMQKAGWLCCCQPGGALRQKASRHRASVAGAGNTRRYRSRTHPWRLAAPGRQLAFGGGGVGRDGAMLRGVGQEGRWARKRKRQRQGKSVHGWGRRCSDRVMG